MDSLIRHLESSRDALLAEISNLAPTQWAARPAGDGWSIMDVVEHLATVEIGVHQVFSGRLFEAPCAPEHKAKTAGKDEIIVEAMRDRMSRRAAPEFVKPAGRWPTPEAAAGAFTGARNALIELLRKETRNLRDYCAPHPSLKAMDGYQWVLFVATHTERHREQIRDLIAMGPPAA